MEGGVLREKESNALQLVPLQPQLSISQSTSLCSLPVESYND